MRKFGRKKGPRKAFMKTLAHNLIMKEKIETNEARARELRSFVEKLITIARKKELAGLRILLSRLPKDAANKLFYEIGPRYKDRSSGQLRIIKTAIRHKRDGVKMSIIEFV